MKANPRFVGQSREFWAHIRTIGQELGYTDRSSRGIKIPRYADVSVRFGALGLNTDHIANTAGEFTQLGHRIFDYFRYRAEVLNGVVQGQLMNKEAARQEFERLRQELNPSCPLPMNKQKGTKKNHAFLTGIVNMLVESNIGGASCDYDPRSLTTVTHKGEPLRTLARRVDGAFPSVVNPIGIWEVKEYYYTTTFGSRVADGVYETLLDGMELEELERAAQRKIFHLLFLDDHFTWWQCGRSYLCRVVDMLHMGYVDEVIFGREVLERLPVVAREWKTELDRISRSYEA